MNSVTSNAVVEVLSYNTTEKKTGGLFQNKPIYRKVLDFGYLPNATSKSVFVNINNLDKIIFLYGFAMTSRYCIPLPCISITSAESVSLFFDYNTNMIIVETGINRSTYNATIVIEYTKTTD